MSSPDYLLSGKHFISICSSPEDSWL